eukprot:10614221-Prorocentrum_lima.AAC.1
MAVQGHRNCPKGWVEVVQEGVVMHHRPYLEVKLKKRELISPNCGKDTLPESKRGNLSPVDNNSEEYRTGLKAAQTE